MPSWGIHIYIAKKVSDELNFNTNDFILANVLPDIYSGYIIEDMPKKMEYHDTHYGMIEQINNSSFMLPDFDKFKKEHKDCKNNLAVLGYYSHLISDYFFNHYAFKNKYIKDEKGQVINIVDRSGRIINADSDFARETKQSDVAIFDYVLLNSINTESIELNDEFISECKKIKKMEIQEKDLVKVENYLNNMINFKEEKKDKNKIKQYVMFSEEELYSMVQQCINIVISKISKFDI